MGLSIIKSISTSQLKDYVANRRENEYSLIDVRQPEEYALERLPGATLIPLPALEHRLHEIDPSREAVIYCRSGNRSMVAARFLADSGMGPSRIYNVAGGMLAWLGRTLAGFPRLGAFEIAGNDREVLELILELEKGAFRYYDALTKRLPKSPFSSVTSSLLQMEQLHAQTAYELLSKGSDDLPTFEEMFDSARGDIVEGGEPFEQLVEKVRDLDQGSTLGLAELALDIELHAYDLYRAVAVDVDNRVDQSAFFSLAEQEKAHIRLLARNWQ